jgi:hypothetical protein
MMIEAIFRHIPGLELDHRLTTGIKRSVDQTLRLAGPDTVEVRYRQLQPGDDASGFDWVLTVIADEDDAGQRRPVRDTLATSIGRDVAPFMGDTNGVVRLYLIPMGIYHAGPGGSLGPAFRNVGS